MYESTNSKYNTLKPVGYSSASPIYSVLGSYGAISSNYQHLISESKCRCRGTCRTGIGCTCKTD